MEKKKMNNQAENIVADGGSCSRVCAHLTLSSTPHRRVILILITEPYNNPFWEKNIPGRRRRRRERKNAVNSGH
jgi:hypothetical protein